MKFILDVLRWKIRPAHTSAYIAPIRPLPGDSAHLGVIKTVVMRGGEEIHVRGGGGERSTMERSRAQVPPWRNHDHVLDLIFKPLNPCFWPTYSPGPGAVGAVQVSVRGARGGKRGFFFLGSWLGRVLL